MHWRFKLTHYRNKNDKSYCEIVNTDKAIFQRMEKGSLPYEIALKKFKKNNSIEDDIPMNEFIAWLQGLGWDV